MKIPVVSMGLLNTRDPELIKSSYDAGIRLFDTAMEYQKGRNEEMLGKVIKKYNFRKNVVILTKILHPVGIGFGRTEDRLNRQQIKHKFLENFNSSLNRLKTDFVDILLYHSVDNAGRFAPTIKRYFKYKDKSFFQTGVLYADKSVFNVFSFEMIKGDAETALEVPFTMVITEETAKKYFGDEDPIGKVMNWDNSFEYTVTGVVKSPPPNSHFTFSVLASFSTFFKYDPRLENLWIGFGAPTYLLLNENTDYKVFENKIEEFKEKYIGQELSSRGIDLRSYLQPLESIHLYSNLAGELGTNGSIRLIYAFAAIAFIILIIACINFMNLSTARSAGRAKEIGLRKVLGAQRKKLVFQFLGESFLFAALSLICAVIIVWFIFPYFKSLAGAEISVDYLKMPMISAALIGIVIFVGIFAGSYPAFFLSGFKPVLTLKGIISRGGFESRFRSILVVSQFTISIFLIIFTIIIFNQQKYFKNKDLGFNKDHLLVISLQNEKARVNLENFKNELLNINGVVSAGASSLVPGETYLFINGTYPEGFTKDQLFMMENFHADFGFFNTYEIKTVKGRVFSKEIITDETQAVMINETAAEKFGWADPIGKEFNIVPGVRDNESDLERRIIIGVYKDFHHRSLYSPIVPTFIRQTSGKGNIRNRPRRLTLRIQDESISETLKKIDRKWKQFYPDQPYFYFFLDESYYDLHRAEEKLGSIFRAFAVLAVLIGCLGLFGLASFSAEKRTKEIGIRKAIGASIKAIVILLCKEFFSLVIIANVIAWPAAYFISYKWLQNFPYAAGINVSIFFFTLILSLIVALVTVGYQSVKAALTNPVDSLRNE
ncbi:aldo/keto reductase [candidate division KSB1 bacterium]